MKGKAFLVRNSALLIDNNQHGRLQHQNILCTLESFLRLLSKCRRKHRVDCDMTRYEYFKKFSTCAGKSRLYLTHGTKYEQKNHAYAAYPIWAAGCVMFSTCPSVYACVPARPGGVIFRPACGRRVVFKFSAYKTKTKQKQKPICSKWKVTMCTDGRVKRAHAASGRAGSRCDLMPVSLDDPCCPC